MNKQLSKLALALGAVVLSGGVMAETTDTATADASATVIAPISVAKDTDLVFGTVAKPNTGETKTVVITTAGARDASSTSNAVGTQTVSAAGFTVTAAAYAYTATVSYEAALATGATLGAVVAKCGGAPDTSITAAGTAVTCASDVTALKVGGTLSLTDTVATGPLSKGDAITVVVAYD